MAVNCPRPTAKAGKWLARATTTFPAQKHIWICDLLMFGNNTASGAYSNGHMGKLRTLRFAILVSGKAIPELVWSSSVSLVVKLGSL